VPAAALVERASEGATEAEAEEATDEKREPDAAAFARSSVRARLLYEAIARKVTSRARVTRSEVEAYYRQHRAELKRPGTTPARARLDAAAILLCDRQRAIMERWVSALKRRYSAQVRYADGY
jgi:hypothetical protein